MPDLPIGFALHQMKNDPEFRDGVVPPPGYTLMEFDAAGQEFRWMAIASGDPVMLQMCEPGEDAHSYMGARCTAGTPDEVAYEMLLAGHLKEEKWTKPLRKNGKVANLCASHSSPILTDRGHVAIQDVRHDDLVWDGIEFVAHDGVVFSGVLPVMTHQGLTLTPDHKVLVDDDWVEFQEVAKRGLRIASACWSKVRIVDGIIRRARKEGQRKIREVCMRVWDSVVGRAPEFAHGQVNGMQVVRGSSPTRRGRTPCQCHASGSNPATEGIELVFALRQFGGRVLSQLWRTWDRVSVCLGQRGGGVRQEDATSPNLRGSGYRSKRQRGALRAGQPAAGHAQGEPAEQAWWEHSVVEGGIDPDLNLGRKSLLADLYDALCGARAFWRRYSAPSVARRSGETQRVANDPVEAPCYDIVNCGPRRRFSANGFIVHNSLQYRTSAPKLLQVARVQYNIDMTMGQAKRIHSVYPRTYRRVPIYWERQIALTKKTKYVETFAGRRVQVEGNWSRDGWRMGSTAINYRIQGTGADQKYLALAVLKGYCVPNDIHLGWDLHDGLYFYVPDAIVDRAAHEIKKRLDNLPYKRAWDFTPPIPLVWDCKVGPSWGQLKGYEFH